jgi:alanyl-tRNA synthetase
MSQNLIKNHRYIIADHIRPICFIISDGVLPSGKGRGYILRRLMRRLLASSMALGIDIKRDDYFGELVDNIVEVYRGVYDEIGTNRDTILSTLLQESTKYQKAITTGQKEWAKIFKSAKAN